MFATFVIFIKMPKVKNYPLSENSPNLVTLLCFASPSCAEDCWLSWLQGDQIGRIFRYWVSVYFWAFKRLCRISPNFWATFFLRKCYVPIILEKKSWATVWAIFLQTHLATLVGWLWLRSASRRHLDKQGGDVTQHRKLQEVHHTFLLICSMVNVMDKGGRTNGLGRKISVASMCAGKMSVLFIFGNRVAQS
jgi:hypothetical protein